MAEAAVKRCNGLKLEEKRGCVGWEIKPGLTVRAIRQRNGLCYLASQSYHWRCLC